MDRRGYFGNPDKGGQDGAQFKPIESIRDGELALGDDVGKEPEGGRYGSGETKERRLSG